MQRADEAARILIPTLICPTRRPAAAYPSPRYPATSEPMRNSNPPMSANRSDYMMSGGCVLVDSGTGPSHADGVAGIGFTNIASGNGLVAQRSEARAAHVRDGMSNTYLIGEKYLNPDNYAAGRDITDDQSAFAGDALYLVGWTNVASAQDTRGVANFHRFGSAHPGGFNTAMADGSTHLIGYEIDPTAHMNRGGRNDRQATATL